MPEESTAEQAETTTMQPPTEAASSSRDYEKEARLSGWVPESEFRGANKPARFMEAEEFVKRGDELIPFIRKENKQLKEKLEAEQKRIDRIERTAAKGLEAVERQHKAELERVKAEQRDAVQAGDLREFERLDKVKENLEKTAPTREEPADPGASLDTKRANWRAENPWFDDDFEMQDFVVRYSDFHGQKHPNLSFEDNMKAVEAEVRKKFPEKFGGKKPAANGHAAVDAGGDFSGVFRGKGKTEHDLPPADREVGLRFVKQGLFKDIKAYAKVYFEENPNG